MKFKFNKTIGKIQFQFEDEAQTHLEFFQKVAFYSELPQACGACGSINIILEYRTPKTFIYVDIFCLDCKKKLGFGQHKEPKGSLFQEWSKGWNLIPTQNTEEKE